MWWYRILTTILGLIAFPYASLRAILGSSKWRDRLGLISVMGKCDVWIHASSVGEVKVASTLIHYLKNRKSNLKLHFTVMTPAGFQTALSECQGYRSDCSVSYLPLDAPMFVSSALRRLMPKALVIAETEIWPNLITAARKSGCRIILVNGRMAEKSYAQYSKVAGMMREVFTCYDHCFLKSEEDLRRFESLGLPKGRGIIVGDMKFDSIFEPLERAKAESTRKRLGVRPDEFLLVAGSTRPGKRPDETEEIMLASAYLKLKPDHPSLRLALAPRHLERTGQVSDALSFMGLRVLIEDEEPSPERPSSDAVILINYMGGLVDLYGAADLAFVGGTLVPLGGHNLLEPVWSGTPVLFGPHIDNVADQAEYITSNRFGALVNSSEDLAHILEQVLRRTLKFEERTACDKADSPTDKAAEYIIERLKDA